MKVYDDLVYRGLIKDITSEKLIDELNNSSLTFYIGTDPTADSMHLGHYSSFLISKRLAKAGHKPILLIGGGTALIGDPKPTVEREIVPYEEVEKNTKGLTKQAEEIFGFIVVNNYEWLKDIKIFEYLRDYGKYFNVNTMLAKDIVSRRLEDGITYSEFSYMLLQSIDYLHLYKKYNCRLQVAGSDQWGNITSGVELIRKKEDALVHGLVMPLILDNKGEKMGKSEGNALWLDKERTPAYDLYQYLFNVSDELVIEYLKKLTFMSKEEIEEMEKKHGEKPELRLAQRRLAKEIITDLHGEEEYLLAEEKSQAIFSNKGDSSATKTFEMTGQDINVVDLLLMTKLCPSKSEARRLIEQGGISLNQEKVKDVDHLIKEDKLNDLLIQRGKKEFLRIIVKK